MRRVALLTCQTTNEMCEEGYTYGASGKLREAPYGARACQSLSGVVDRETLLRSCSAQRAASSGFALSWGGRRVSSLEGADERLSSAELG